MPRKDATPKQTGGGGFDFEEEVVAYFLLHLLAGLPPLEHLPHALTRVGAQKAASDWHLDDVLLTLDIPDGAAHVAISVKSNVQFSGGRFPADFVQDAWEQVLQTTSQAYDPERDWLGFVTAPSASIEANLNALLTRSRHQSPDELASDLGKPRRANAAIRKLHTSAACPPVLTQGRGPTYPGQVLRRLIWMPFDLDSEPSFRRARAKELALSLTASGTPQDAEILWTLVKRVASDIRTTSGSSDRAELVRRLRPLIALRGLPAHRGDWDRLRQDAEASVALVPHKIGGVVDLKRISEREALADSLSSTGAIALLGASGVGKTVLARLLALDALNGSQKSHVVWASATDFSAGPIERRLALDNPFRDLVRHDAGGGLLILDQLDRLYQAEAFGNAIALLHAVGLGEDSMAAPFPRWQVVITCTPEAWDRVQRELLRHSISPGAFVPAPINSPNLGDLEEVWRSFPALGRLRLRRHLSPVLLRPKVLDLLARESRLRARFKTSG